MSYALHQIKDRAKFRSQMAKNSKMLPHTIRVIIEDGRKVGFVPVRIEGQPMIELDKDTKADEARMVGVRMMHVGSTKAYEMSHIRVQEDQTVQTPPFKGDHDFVDYPVMKKK